MAGQLVPLIFDRGEARIIGDHVLALFVPSRIPAVPDTYGGLKPGDLEGWSGDALQLLVEEGRRRLDATNDQFEAIRNKSQYVLATSLATTGFVVGFVDQIVDSIALFLAWFIVLTALLTSVLVSFATFAATARLGSVDPLLFSRTDGKPEVELIKSLARAYVKASSLSTSAVHVRFTLYRDSIWFLVAGVGISIATWGIHNLSG